LHIPFQSKSENSVEANFSRILAKDI
jgi:hypothetical protein